MIRNERGKRVLHCDAVLRVDGWCPVWQRRLAWQIRRHPHKFYQPGSRWSKSTIPSADNRWSLADLVVTEEQRTERLREVYIETLEQLQPRLPETWGLIAATMSSSLTIIDEITHSIRPEAQP